MLDKPPLVEVENEFYSQFGRRVKSHRSRKHLTQQELSTRLSLSRSSIANIELGRQKILLHQLFDLAEALNTTPWDLLPVSPDQVDVTDQLRDGQYPERMIEWATRVRDSVDKRLHE